MEGIQKAFRSAMSQDPNGSLSSISSALEKAPIKSSATVSSAEQSQLLLTRSSRFFPLTFPVCYLPAFILLIFLQ